MMKATKLKKIVERNEENKSKRSNNDNISNLMNLKIKNENIHIKNIIRTIHYVYTNKYDSETGFNYIKDILKNIIKGNVYDIVYKKYINPYCIYEICCRILLNIIKVNNKDENFNKIVEFLFDILYYCDIILSENKNKKKKTSENYIEGNNSVQEYELITRLWNRLLDNVFIKDKKQRINMCKVIKSLVKKACVLQIDVSNKLCKKHVNIFLSLLNDKDHNIRVLCLNILEPFQDFNTKGSFLKCLDDVHNMVRINAIKNISINVKDLTTSPSNNNNNNNNNSNNNNSEYLIILKNFLIRINDINHNVRSSVYDKLKNYYFYIPSDMKFELLLCGLNDKEKSVRESCYHMILHWVQHFDDKIENLLLHILNSDIDNDLIVEQICKVHLNNIRKDIIKTVSMENYDEKKEYDSKNVRNDTSTYNENWFNYCLNNLFSLNVAELYMFRIYVQHFSDEQEKEKIDALQVINTIYYYLYLSRFNERLYYNRKNYINCVENNDADESYEQSLFCTCGKGNIYINDIEDKQKNKYIQTSIFDDDFCDKCIYYRTVTKMCDSNVDMNNENKNNENKNNEHNNNENNNNNKNNEHNNNKNNNSEQNNNDQVPNKTDEESSNTHENVLINEDNINENYNYLCNIKNLLLICKYLDIIEIYQVEKILKCCSTILLTGPLREVIIKGMLNNTGVNYYKLQKGHITCAYWLSNSYIYACIDLLRQMIYIKNKNNDVNDIEINLTNHVLSIISEIKEPFENNEENENVFSQEKEIIKGFSDEPNRLSKNYKSFEQVDSNPLTVIFNNIMNVENDSIFDIIRKKQLNTLSIEHLLILCKKMQHKLDVTEAKIKDLTEMEKVKEHERANSNNIDNIKSDEYNDNENKKNGDINNNSNISMQMYTFHEQIRFHTEIFLKQITMLSLLRLELKRRWLRILFILECFLCKSKSHCSFDSALREFPNELLLPALNFCCSVMPEWDDKEIEDQFYDILVSKCLGNWCMFIGNDEELKKQIYAYKTAIVDTCEVLNTCLLNIEQIHASVYPNIYNKGNIDIMSFNDKFDQNINNNTNQNNSNNNNNNSNNNNSNNNNSNNNFDEDVNKKNYIFYEYNSPNEYLLNFFSTNQDAWYDYKELLEKLEINSLRCEIYICVLGDLLMTHPNLNNDELIVDAVESLWNYLNGNLNTSKYIQSICLRVICKLLLTEYLGNHIYNITNEELYILIKRSSNKLRALFEMCFLISPATYNCVQDFKKISTHNMTNINSHDKLFLFSIFSMYPSMSENNLLIFHYTFEQIIFKTSEAVLKYNLKTAHFTNILTFMIFTILHKANINFIVYNMSKYIKWILLIIIEKGVSLTNRSNIIELVYKIIHIYLFQDLTDMQNLEKNNSYETKEVKKRGRKKKKSLNESLDENNEQQNKHINKNSSIENNITNNINTDQQLDGHKNQNDDFNNDKNKKNEFKSTILFKSAQINVNDTIKDLKSFYVLINFCMHSSDIIKSKNEIRYCEVLKECIDNKIEQIKQYFIKNNLIKNNNYHIGNNDINQEKGKADNPHDNLLDLKKIDELKEETIYEEIIQDYVNYIEHLHNRNFIYPLIPKGSGGEINDDRMTTQEILNEINNNNNNNNNNDNSFNNNDNSPVNKSLENMIKMRDVVRRQQRISTVSFMNTNIDSKVPKEDETMKYHDINKNEDIQNVVHFDNKDISENIEHIPEEGVTDMNHINEINNENVVNKNNYNNISSVETNENTLSLRSNENITYTYKEQPTLRSESKEEIKSIKEDKDLDKYEHNNSIKKKIAEMNSSSSDENTDSDKDDSSVNEYESVKNYDSDIYDEGNKSDSSSLNSNDSTAMAFKRLNKLRRTSYTNVVSK